MKYDKFANNPSEAPKAKNRATPGTNTQPKQHRFKAKQTFKD